MANSVFLKHSTDCKKRKISFTVIIWIFRYMAPQLERLICGLAWGGWSRREVCFHSGGEMVSTSWKLPLNPPLSLWPTNRSVDKQWESGTMSSVLLSVYLTRGRKSSNCILVYSGEKTIVHSTVSFWNLLLLVVSPPPAPHSSYSRSSGWSEVIKRGAV